ncbi:MAG: GIY-YIG nuclease family protein [Bacteroidales bacterium]
MHIYSVYIMTNFTNTVLYIGVTNNLYRRIYEHKSLSYEGFTKLYKCTKIVYYEDFGDINQAIAREKQLKNWKRKWKEELIDSFNPKWEDLVGDD